MTLKGKLVREDLGAGVWVLETDDGRRVMLDGDVPVGLAGKRVEVDGKSTDSQGFGMVGDGAFAVRNIKRA
jgi:hypothetical protein